MVPALKQENDTIDEEDYNLLNAFEMLWNLDKATAFKQFNIHTQGKQDQAPCKEEIDLVANQSSEEMDLVHILSHDTPSASQAM